MKEKLAKTTVMLPEALLKEAQAVTNAGITQTIRTALELLASKRVYEKLLRLEGTYKSEIKLDELRED